MISKLCMGRVAFYRTAPGTPAVELASGVPLSTFLFDLDGTLIDSIDLILRSYRHTMRTHRGEEPSDDVWMDGLGTPLWVQFRRFTDDPAEIEAMVATYRDYNLAHHDELVRPYEGVVEAVRALQRPGRTLGLVTSKMRSGAFRGLRRAGLEDAFDVVVGADEVTHPKPHPEPVLIALERLAAPAAGAVFIGDSRHDLECGRAAGVKTAAVLWGPFDRAHLADLEPDYWLERPQDLSLLATDD
ncbi:MAG TPA: HAD-IA family hydrolase [Gemmatimonadales bacterium]|nr:HAD-IA family hydrolase [Gemmatimonadales bacterium]